MPDILLSRIHSAGDENAFDDTYLEAHVALNFSMSLFMQLAVS